jgi:hypothetical protein
MNTEELTLPLGKELGRVRIDNQTTQKNSAGSGILVPPFGNISNPRVLSDMGLAIPRPTRLGDPRPLCASLSDIILTSLISFPQASVDCI